MFDWENDREQLLNEIEEMISRKRYTQLRDRLATMAAPDVALLMQELEEDKLPLVFRLLPKEQAAEVFVELDSD